MGKVTGPDLKRYMDKTLNLKLNGNRTVQGVLRGFDQFMNITLEDTVELVSSTESNKIGMVVSVRADKQILWIFPFLFLFLS